MGEAKRRKQSDPSFGRVPKEAANRGLVISPPIEVEGSNLFVTSSTLDPQELRFALFFWDRLVWPSSRAIYFESGADEQFLQEMGILTRPEYTVWGDGAQGIAQGQIQAFLDLEQREPGVWSLAQSENSLLLKGQLVAESGGALVELHRAIPIPTADVPLNEILEFKEKRRDELLFLRSHLDSFIRDLDAATDKDVELERCIKEIDDACSNLLRLGREWQFPVYLSNFKASFAFNGLKFLSAVGGGWKLGEPYGLTAATAAAASAGAVSTLDIKADYGLCSIRRPKSPYRYAYHIDKELA